MRTVLPPTLVLLCTAILTIGAYSQAPSQVAPAAPAPQPAAQAQQPPAPPAAAPTQAAPTVPPANPPAAVPVATPLSPVPSAQSGSGVVFDDRFTSFEEEAMPQPMLRFKYRLWPYVDVSETQVEANGQPLDIRAVPFSSSPLNETALLILVDTSRGSSRQPRQAIVPARAAIEQIVNASQPRTLIGLYTFSNDLTELAPIGSKPDVIKQKLTGIKADGLGTRLYRRAIDAVAKLSAAKAERKAILIISDGKDEDTGYGLENLREACEKAGIIVMALGTPETGQDIPALGALERLATETKGFYAQLPVGARMPPPDFAPSVLRSLDGGGDVAANLKGVPAGATVTVKLTTSNGDMLERSITLQAPAAAVVSPTPSPSASPTPVPPPLTFTEKIGAFFMAPENRLWVILGGVALLLFGIGLLILLIRLMRSTPPPPPPPTPTFAADSQSHAETTVLHSSGKGSALAYLVLQDANATKMPLNKTATRIGRRSDNDLVFSNTSVSGHHAEIHMSRDGAFSITDLGSGNGVYVNGNKVQQHGLRDGDTIELGEVRFRFTL